MRLSKYLNESERNPIVVVDVQPSYDKWISFSVYDMCEYLNDSTGDILVFYVGKEYSGITNDSKHDVINYYIDHGLDEEVLDRMEFIDKGYGFFRSWMDIGIDEDDILDVLRYMKKNRINDSRDIDEEFFEETWPDIYEYFEDNISMPDFDERDLRSYNNCVLIGGGRNECLAEIEIAFDLFKIKYRTNRKYIY